IKKYPWYMAPWQGILTTGNLTLSVVRGYARAIGNVFRGVPSGVQIAGPVRIIFEILPQAQQMGITYFMNFLGLISVYLAILNILPIPAFDGGKLLFLGIEAIRKKPVSQKIEQSVTAFFFSLLILLMIWVTIRDITKLF
ncbi:MAG: site-2 protease family protein, partial [Candidatus Paceibacterales bacterium]